MKFKNWKIWLMSKPWSLRWFIFLILLRPVIDNFYFLKKISPALSPLYWAGVLTPLLCVPAILKYKYQHNRIHQLFNIWSGLIILNILFVAIQPGELILMLSLILKLSLPVYLFLFIRIFITNKTDFKGLLTTFLYASLVAALMLLYELLVKPIRIEYSRGLERIQGGYADVMNYAIYLTFGFLVLSYFYFSSKFEKTNLKISLILLLSSIGFCLAGLIGISHTASYAVFAALLLLFLASSTRRFGYVTFIVIVVIFIAAYFYGGDFYDQKIAPLTSREVEVMEGTRNESQMFNGRMSRWQYGWNNFKESPATAWLFGYPTSLEDPIFNITIGIHNDYLRIFYFTGFVGLFCYSIFLYLIWKRKKFLQMPEKYLLYGSLAILLLYSVSTTPTFYANFLYVSFTILAYLALPPVKLVSNV